MSSARVNRHLANQAKLKIARELREELAPYRITVDLENESVNQEFESDVLKQFFDKQKQELDYFSSPVTVSNEDANALVSEIKGRWNDEQMTILLDGCKKSVLQSVVVPFGLGYFVAGYDKKGGNIDTVHNARNGVYASEKERISYENRAKYDSDKVHKDKRYINRNREISEARKNGGVQDAYSDKILGRHDKVDLDHVISAKQIHEDAGRILAGIPTEKLANISENLKPTSDSVNRSKNAMSPKEFAVKLENNEFERRSRIQELNQNKNNLTDKKISELSKLNKLDGVDTQKLREEGKNAQLEQDKRINGEYYSSEKFLKNTMSTSSLEAGKIGLQQSIGLLLTEFFAATFDEISDAYKNGFKESLKNQNFFEALQVRLFRIAKRVAASWKNALSAFKEGAISGFLSNLVTMLINTLVTTGKRIVRVIREGFLSIMKALKIAMSPSEGMTRAEASDAALKLLATGVTVSLGILAEEAVEKTVLAFFTTHLPPLAPFAPTVSAIFVGAMTGIASSLLVYGLDQLDIFGVNNQRKHEFVLLELDSLIAESDKNFDSAYGSEMNRIENMLVQLQPD
ncbi:MAG: hypothetical protein WBI40_01195 [Methylococcaceae bacterium]